MESRWGRDFLHPVQTGSDAHTAFYTMGTESFSEVKWPGRGADYPHHLAPRLKKGYSYTSIPPLVLHVLF